MNWTMTLSKSAGSLLTLALIVMAPPALAYECWRGWGYMVDPQTNAYKSGQALCVADGPVNWSERRWVKLYRLEPASGLGVENGKSLHVRPLEPVQKGSRNWADIAEDVRGSDGRCCSA